MAVRATHLSTETAEDLNEFLALIEAARKRWDFDAYDNAGPWYRGQQRKHWRLLPSVYRIGCSDRRAQDNIREEFATRASALSRYEPMPTNEWDLYFLMQHYGAPTRLLDWTESPVIALYFAVRDNPGHYDSAVWILNPYQLNQQSIKTKEVVSPGAPGANPRDLAKVNPWLPPRWSKKAIPILPVAIFPTHIARRISSQKSCFTVHGTSETAFERIGHGADPLIRKIIIPGHAVKSIRLSLKTFGIDDTTIFPDLEGLGRALATAYKDDIADSSHRDVYVRLRPSSSRSGEVGVFAIKQIPKNTRVFAGENEEVSWVSKAELPKRGALRKLYDDFSIINSTRYGSPVSFNRLTPAWFINDSKRPNTRCDENYDFHSLRIIRTGEELTVDYDTFSVNPAKKSRSK